ncbi:MAG: Kelch repeat-containing protein, partial [Chloroflexota bacterium]
MHPLSERYSDLLGDGTDPALIRLIEDLDRVCAPGPLPAQRDLVIAHTIEKRIAMQLTIAGAPGRVPVTSTPRATKGKTWLTLGWAALLPTLLLLAVVVVLRNRQPNTTPQMGTVPKVFQVAAGTPLSSALVKSGTWTVTGSMHQPRSVQVAALLADGRVLVAGGCGACTTNRNRNSAEIYDPRTGKWTMTGSMHDPRSEFTMTLLPSGQVLALGGCSTADCSAILASAELYNPRTGKWTVTSTMDDYRALHTATLLPNGQVLVTGGDTRQGNTADAEIYNPQTGKWNPISPMHDARARHTATL